MMKTKYLLLLFFLIILSASVALLLWLARTGEYQTMGLVSLALSLSFAALVAYSLFRDGTFGRQKILGITLIVIGILCPFRVYLDYCLVSAGLSPVGKPVCLAVSIVGILAVSAFLIKNFKDLSPFSQVTVATLLAVNILSIRFA